MTMAPERDENGRFMKTEPEARALPGSDSVHPLSKVLFGWVEHRRTPRLLLTVVVLVSIGLFSADFILDRHDYLSLAETKGFYAIWGFGSFALAVLAGWPLGYLLRRSEDYYGEAETRPKDTETGE